VDRLAAMEAFVRVIEAGSFSVAARQLHVGQPAVSKTIVQLEDRLGVRLLLRSTHGLTPTEAGRTFYERAKRAIVEAEEAELAARGAASALSGRLRVVVAVTFARLHVLPRLPRFLADHPALDIDILLQDGDVDLVGAGIDVALRMTPLRDLTLIGRRDRPLPAACCGDAWVFRSERCATMSSRPHVVPGCCLRAETGRADMELPEGKYRERSDIGRPGPCQRRGRSSGRCDRRIGLCCRL
jgi:DNA-binding transcriptional LysR family regulator